MACHEIAALRLGLMNVVGIVDEAGRQHEVNEIGPEYLGKPGPIKSLAEAKNIKALKSYFSTALTELEQKTASLKSDAPEMGYYRSLLILNKKVEMELENAIVALEKTYRDLDEMHDFVHEIYPAR